MSAGSNTQADLEVDVREADSVDTVDADQRRSRVVVGVDGSAGSRAALAFAAEEARLRGARLEVVVAWQYPVLTTMPAFGVLPPVEEMAAEAREGLLQFLQDERLTDDPQLEVTPVVVQGPAAAALIEASKGADLLVVGSRGHGGFTGLLLGSVSQACVTHATCPVVVVPTPRDQSHL
ncbi:MAG: universal stress protein [Acidimicrobiales bacterium]